MAYGAYGFAAEGQNLSGAGHRLTLEGRERLTITGVTDVDRFDEAAVILQTTVGSLIVRGDGLHMQTLSLEGGEVSIDGQVDSLSYEDSAPGGFFARLFG